MAPLTGSSFDVIVSNPPYIDAEDPHLAQGDVRFEPESALISDENGLADIRTIIETSKQYLKAGGWLLLEHGWQQGPDVRNVFAQNGYSEIETLRDLAGHERATSGKLLA